MKVRSVTAFSILILTLSTVASVSASSVVPKARTNASRIDEYISRAMEAGRIPGLALAILEGHEVTCLKGYGVADRSGRAVTPQTPFFLGSVGKTLTALGIRQLVNEGRIAYDTTVRECIPWFTLADADAAARITVRHLIEHKSGLSRAAGSENYTFQSKYNVEQLVRKLAQVELVRPPGAAREYSNLNFVILGHIIETVSGLTYEQYIQKNIFDRLEMKTSFLSRQPAEKAGLAAGHKIVFGITVPLELPWPTAQVPAGFQISSAEDMARYVSLFLNNGYFKGESVIPNNELPERKPPLGAFAENERGYLAYWQIFRKPDRIGTGHAGGDGLYSTVIRIFPLSMLGIVVLANCSDTVSAESIGEGIAAILEGKQPAAPDRSLPAHWLLALVACAIVALLVFRAGRARRFPGLVSEKGARPLLAWALFWLLDGALPLFILLGIPRVGDMTWKYHLIANPEIASIQLASALLLAATGLTKVFLLIRKKQAGQKASA